jgi:hypothetical protein
MLPPPSSSPPRGSVRRYLLGLLVYLIGSIVLQFALLFASQYFKLHLEHTQTLFPSGTPVVGQMSWFSLIYLLFLIAMIWLLYRTGLLPRQMFQPRSPRSTWQRSGMTASLPPTPDDTLDISGDENTSGDEDMRLKD